MTPAANSRQTLAAWKIWALSFIEMHSSFWHFLDGWAQGLENVRLGHCDSAVCCIAFIIILCIFPQGQLKIILWWSDGKSKHNPYSAQLENKLPIIPPLLPFSIWHPSCFSLATGVVAPAWLLVLQRLLTYEGEQESKKSRKMQGTWLPPYPHASWSKWL